MAPHTACRRSSLVFFATPERREPGTEAPGLKEPDRSRKRKHDKERAANVAHDFFRDVVGKDSPTCNRARGRYDVRNDGACGYAHLPDK